MSARGYLVGLIFFALTAGSVSVAAVIVARRRLRHLSGAEQLLAVGILASAGLIAAYLLPGLVGLLSRTSALIVSLALLAAMTRVAAAGPDARRPSRGRLVGGAAASVIAALGALVFCVGTLAYLFDNATAAVGQIDKLTFHLPVVVRWLQSHSVWHVYEFVPYLGQGNYPQNGEVLTLAAIAPWGNDAFERFATLPFVALTVVSVYALARLLQAPRPAALLFGVCVVAIPDAFLSGVADSLPDAVLYALFGAALVFLARACSSGRTSDLALAGLALGLAFGSKWYGVSCVVAVVAVWVVISLVRRAAARRVAWETALTICLIALGGGFWLVRNIVGSGTPFFPGGWLPFGAHPEEALGATGGTHIDFTVAHYLSDGRVLLHYVVPDLFHAFRLPGVVLLAGLVATSAALRWRSARPLRRSSPLQLSLLATTLVLVAVYLVTPDTAQGPAGHPYLIAGNARYLVPAALPLAALSAWAAGRIGRFGVALELLCLIAIVDGVHYSAPDIPAHAVIAATAVVLGGATVVVWLTRRWRASRSPRVAAAGASAALLVGVVVAGQLVQRHFNAHRYVSWDATTDWIRLHAPRGQRVGLAGKWAVTAPTPVYPAFGPDLDNYVAYVGPFTNGGLREYRSAAAFSAALARGRYTLLLIGLGDPPVGHAREQTWATVAGYRRVAQSRFLALYVAPSRMRATSRVHSALR